MVLYLVIRHRKAKPSWKNEWLDDDRLRAIETTAEIGSLCENAKENGEQVFVHRCGTIS